MSAIRYVTGDATMPTGSGPRVIAHIVNDSGGWGRGFVVALSHRSSRPELAYRAWYRDRAVNDFRLGSVQMVRCATELWVANMIGQHGMRKPGRAEPAPIRYEAVNTALAALGRHAFALGASVHMPRIGCGLAGGEWARIEPMILVNLCGNAIDVTVYDPGEWRTSRAARGVAGHRTPVRLK